MLFAITTSYSWSFSTFPDRSSVRVWQYLSVLSSPWLPAFSHKAQKRVSDPLKLEYRLL